MKSKNITILGLGLMGASLGLALKRSGFSGRRVGYARREATRHEAMDRDVVDEIFADPSHAVSEADLVVLCTPIMTMVDMVTSILGSLKPGCLVTDVGSTKAHLDKVLGEMLKTTGALFIGSHPVAGSEKQGLESAREDLYQDAVVVVCPGHQQDADAVDEIANLWGGVGSKVVNMSPDDHDRILARTSHLPHLAAVLLALTVGRPEDRDTAAPLCGPGFRDTSRVADGSPGMWEDIVATNADALKGELGQLRGALDKLDAILEKEDWPALKALLEKARDHRQSILGNPASGEETG